jgi:hypothetical protein
VGKAQAGAPNCQQSAHRRCSPICHLRLSRPSPELRFERAYNMPAYDLGTKKNQFTFAIDAIIRY